MAEWMHPKGKYEAKVIDHGYNQATTGSYQFFAEFQTEAGSIIGFFSLSEKAISHTLKKIRAMGFQHDDLDILGDGKHLRGNMCRITVDHEHYDGQWRAKVGWVNPYHGGVVERIDSKSANLGRFSALLKQIDKVEAVKEDAPQKKYTEEDPPPASYEDNFGF